MKSPLMEVEEVMATLQVKKTAGYAIIKKLNAELQNKGYLTARGKVNRQYLYERYGLKGDDK